MSGPALAAAAENLVGCSFRLHGREPATGLDCIGVLSAAMSLIGRPAALPNAYRLRSSRTDHLSGWAKACKLVPAEMPILPGDVLMVRSAPCQLHLLVAVGAARFVHAHMKQKRVVVHAGPLRWPVVGHWRLGPDQ